MDELNSENMVSDPQRFFGTIDPIFSGPEPHIIPLQSVNPHSLFAKAVEPDTFLSSPIYSRYVQGPEKYVNNNKKFIINVDTSTGHIVIDTLLSAIKINSLYPDADIVLLQHGLISLSERERTGYYKNDLGHSLMKIPLFIKKIIESRSNAKVYLSQQEQGTYLIANNIFIPKHIPPKGDQEMAYADVPEILRSYVFENYPEYCTDNPLVYISRKNTRLRYNLDYRVFNEERLEGLFRGMGFKVVYAEDFSSFEEQVGFFYNTKILAGVTGAGLNAALYVPNDSMLLEITVPLVVPLKGQIQTRRGIPLFDAQVHTMYRQMASIRGMQYLSISAFNRQDGEDLSNFISANPIYSFLKNLARSYIK